MRLSGSFWSGESGAVAQKNRLCRLCGAAGGNGAEGPGAAVGGARGGRGEAERLGGEPRGGWALQTDWSRRDTVQIMSGRGGPREFAGNFASPTYAKPAARALPLTMIRPP